MPPKSPKGVPQTPVHTGHPDGSRSTSNTTKYPGGAETTRTTTINSDGSSTYETIQKAPNGSTDTVSTTIGRGEGPPVTTGTTKDPNGNVTSSGTMTTGPDGNPQSTGDYNWDKPDYDGPINDSDLPPPKSNETPTETTPEPEPSSETDEMPSEDDPAETDTKCDASCKALAFAKGLLVGAVVGFAIAAGMAWLTATAPAWLAGAAIVGLFAWGANGISQLWNGWGGLSTEQKWETAGGVFGGILGGGLFGALRRPKPSLEIPAQAAPEVPPAEPIGPKPSGGTSPGNPHPPKPKPGLSAAARQALLADILNRALALGVGTPRDAAVLWSGLGSDGPAIAAAWARAHGGITLEMTPGGAFLESLNLFGPNSPFTRAEASALWARVSHEFASQASGQVRVLVGRVSPNSVYATVERPVLAENPNVLGVEEIPLLPTIGVK